MFESLDSLMAVLRQDLTSGVIDFYGKCMIPRPPGESGADGNWWDRLVYIGNLWCEVSHITGLNFR